MAEIHVELQAVLGSPMLHEFQRCVWHGRGTGPGIQTLKGTVLTHNVGVHKFTILPQSRSFWRALYTFRIFLLLNCFLLCRWIFL